jgi:thiol-disulfide isomerase/thioredoxin
MSKTTCTAGITSDKITLECIAHDDDPGDILQYDWSATGGQLESDGESSTAWVPPAEVGKYYVTCEISDGNGGFDSEDSGKIRVTSYGVMNPAPAPGFSAERLVGEGSFGLGDYTPGNVVMLNYWSTLCGPCIAEFPEFMEIREHYAGQDFALILMDLDANKNTAANWVAGHDYKAEEWGWDSGSAIFNQYKGYNDGITSIPQTFMIDCDGNVRFAKVGSISQLSEYTDIIDELV